MVRETDSPHRRDDRSSDAQVQLRLAAALAMQGRRAEAESCYRELIARIPALAPARFNLACFLRQDGRLDEALREYERALELGIERPEEAWSNMAVIHSGQRRDAAARDCLDRALELNPTYVPAMYNLALLHEESGDREAALRLFRDILAIDPGYANALVRLAHAQRIGDDHDPLVARLRRFLRRPHLDALTRESLHFALGKVYDDCGHYPEAFEQYELGNHLSTSRLQPYDRLAAERRTEDIVRTLSAERVAAIEPVSERSLVFITGMFRSGSTLIEQMLAAHPRIAAGGEIDYFHRQLDAAHAPFPALFAAMAPSELRKLGTGYLEYLDKTFPVDAIVTNKRPDAAAFLGILKALFPNCRIVHTMRHPADTCLSIWFQQLDGRIAYASDLGNIGHHLRQHRRLMSHWKCLFGTQIFDVSYEDLIAEPQSVVERLLAFLGLDLDDGCLDFKNRRNRVRTASVWQVREPLYRSSSGRWRHYEKWLQPVLAQLEAD